MIALDQKCICEICTCGQHHCPHPRPKGEFQTSYQNSYKHLPRASSQISPLLQAAIHKTTLPFEGVSEYKKVYNMDKADLVSSQRKPVEVSQKMSPSVIPQDKFEGYSSYKDSYKVPELTSPAFQSTRALNYELKKLPFQGVTSYKNDFHKPAPNKAPTDRYGYTKPSHGNILSPAVTPFQGLTSYKDHFLKPDQSQIDPIKMSLQDIPRSNTRFEGQSSYRDHYHQRRMQERREEGCPCVRLKVPSINYTAKEHLNYNAEKGLFT